MPIDFGKISQPKGSKRPVDPIELFQSLPVTDPAINDLWLAQGDTLRSWHSGRALGDVALVLNTGAGKTLIGLLAAQSLVNETSGHVLYVCSSIQLVEQTAAKAKGYGLDVTTYFHSSFSNDLYQSGLAPCITTYQALFNGKSRFLREDLTAIVFDDAHTAEHLLRDHFTLRISRKTFPDVFSQIANLFFGYYTQIGKGVSYAETQTRQDAATCWFVPPFAVRAHLAELQRLLLSAGLGAKLETMFTWEHLKDHVDLCALFVSGQEVSLTPAIIPVQSLSYFDKRIRRLYLSATLAAKDAFLRTFGRIPDRVIAPETTAGECERLIIVPSLHPEGRDDTSVAKQVLASRKALILVPTYQRAKLWSDVVTEEHSYDVNEQIENFKRAGAPATLLLVGRYDGVDLPGDTCRIMVIDDLPSSVGPLERYLWDQLGLVKSLRSTVASRVVQSFGRISRGMSDHGVVLLTGNRLVAWLITPLNRAILPPFLRRQLELGIAVSKQAASASELVDAAEQCLNRDAGWIKYYQDSMRELTQVGKAPEDEEAIFLANVEVRFGDAMWSRDYTSAAKLLATNLENTFRISLNTGAWHALWLGYCYEQMGDPVLANKFYIRAHSAAKNIPPSVRAPLSTTEQLSPQVLEVAAYLQGDAWIRTDIVSRFDTDLAALDGAGSSAQTEEAIRALGEYLGLEASRPDKEFGTGPDVLWFTAGGTALNLEVKVGKKSGTYYDKNNLGQLRDHVQWIRDHVDSSSIISAFVGPMLPASSDSNPDPDVVVIELAELKELAERLRAALEDITARALPLTLGQVVMDVFSERNLLWPGLYDHITKHVLRDIGS